MSYVHSTSSEMSKDYLAVERRYNYTTPKSFLEQIALYQKLLALKTQENVNSIKRLAVGLEKIEDASEQVDGMQEELAAKEASFVS